MRRIDRIEKIIATQKDVVIGKFPQNLYDYILRKLKEDNRPELNKKPFNDASCKEDVLLLLRIVMSLPSKTVPYFEEKRILISRFVRRINFRHIACSNLGLAERAITSTEKGVNSIVEYLCDVYTINLSEKAIDTLKLIGISSLSDIYDYNRYYISIGILREKLCALVWRRKINKKVYNEVANFLEKVSGRDEQFFYKEEDNVDDFYPSNVYTHILANMDKEELSQRPFLHNHNIVDIGNIVKSIIDFNKDGILDKNEQKVLIYRFKECWSLDKIGAEFNIGRVKVRNCIKTATKKIVKKVFDVYNDMNSYVNLCKYRYTDIEDMLELGIYTEKDYYDAVEKIKSGKLFEGWESVLRFESTFNLKSSLSDEDVISEFGDKVLIKIDLPSCPNAFNDCVDEYACQMLKEIDNINTVEELFLFDIENHIEKPRKEKVFDLKKLLRKYFEIELTIKRLKEAELKKGNVNGLCE